MLLMKNKFFNNIVWYFVLNTDKTSTSGNDLFCLPTHTRVLVPGRRLFFMFLPLFQVLQNLKELVYFFTVFVFFHRHFYYIIAFSESLKIQSQSDSFFLLKSVKHKGSARRAPIRSFWLAAHWPTDNRRPDGCGDMAMMLRESVDEIAINALCIDYSPIRTVGKKKGVAFELRWRRVLRSGDWFEYMNKAATLNLNRFTLDFQTEFKEETRREKGVSLK